MLELVPKAVRFLLPSLIVAAALMPSSVPAHSNAGEELVPEEWRITHPGPYTITLALYLDNEAPTDLPIEQSEIHDIVTRADAMFEAADIHLQMLLFNTWDPPEAVASIQDLLYAFTAKQAAGPADIAVALSGQLSGAEAGSTHPDHQHIVVKHHTHRRDQDALILAHEIGHALGLDHHDCGHAYCIMSTHDFDPDEHWCPDHYRLLRANGGYFQYLRDHSND